MVQVKAKFRIQTDDPGSLAMRLGKISEPSGEWFNTPCSKLANLSERNEWRPVRTY